MQTESAKPPLEWAIEHLEEALAILDSLPSRQVALTVNHLETALSQLKLQRAIQAETVPNGLRPMAPPLPQTPTE